MPQPNVPLKVVNAGLFSVDNDLFAIPELEDSNVIDYSFDPLSTFFDTDTRRYETFLNELNDRRENYTGSRVDIDKLPLITREIDHSNPESRAKNKRYYYFRNKVKKLANNSTEFRYNLPDYKKEKLYDDFTNEAYGLYQTMAKMLPPKGTDMYDTAKDDMMQVFKDEWKQRISKTVTYAADEYAKQWSGGLGDLHSMAGQQFKSIVGSSMQANEDIYGGMAYGLQKLDNWTKSIMANDYTFMLGDQYKQTHGDPEAERTIESFGESFRNIGQGMEMSAKSAMELLKSPSGKYLESGADLPWLDGYLNPFYMYLKLVENAPNHFGTTVLGVGSAIGAAALTAGGPPGVVAAGTAFSQIPSLMANFALETGDMYASSRDHLYDLRDEAGRNKGRMSNDLFNEKYTFSLNKDSATTADKLSDDDIHEISKDLAKLYGFISTGIEGATNLVTVNKWLKDFGTGVASGMATKEGKKILGKKAVEKFGKEIGKYKDGTIKSVFTGIGMEALQEFLQEGTGELMKANAMPGYKFNVNVPLDAAYSGGLWGGVTYTSMGIYRNARAKRMDRLWQKAVDGGLLEQDKVAERSANQIDAILKAAIITSNDIESVVTGLSADPDNQETLRERAYELVVGGNLFSSDPQELANELTANRNVIADALGLNVENLVNADIEFNDKQIADILGNEYTETALDQADVARDGETDVTGQAVDLTSRQKDPTFDQHTNLGRDDSSVLMQEEKVAELENVLNIAEKNPLAGETTEDTKERIGNIKANLANETKILNELKGAVPNPKGDPDSIKTQAILDRANEIPKSEWTDEELKVVNAIRRKNASEARYDEAKNLIVKKKKAYDDKLEQQKIEKEEEIKKKVAEADRVSPTQDPKLVNKMPARDNQSQVLKRGYKWYAISIEDDKTVRVQGKKIDLGTGDRMTHFIYKDGDEWVLTNEQTGKALLRGKTQQEVISAVKDKLDEVGIDVYRSKVKEGYTQEFGKAIGIAKPDVEFKGPAEDTSDTYEVSTKGDKRFSALNAKLSDGRTIEEHYQVDVKGYKSIKEGKGKPPKDKNIDTYAEYKKLWGQWADENPELIAELAELSEGKILTDMFATTQVSQARALNDILIEQGFKADKERFTVSTPDGKVIIGDTVKEKPNPMTDDDANIIAKNITDVIIDESFADKDWSLMEGELRALAMDDPAALMHIAYVKGIPDLSRFTDENDQLDLKKGSDLIKEIIGLDTPTELPAGVGAFPLFKRGTKQRLHRWFNRFWFQSKKKFGRDDSSFWAWSEQVAQKIPSQYRPYFLEWAEQVPKELSAVDTMFSMIFPDQMSAFSPEESQLLDTLKDADGKMDKIYEQDTDDSGGDLYLDGWNKINTVAFEPLGLSLDTEEVAYIKRMINKVPDFETWLTEISKQVPLRVQEEIWELALNPEVRRKLKMLYASSLTRNITRINRDFTGVDGDTGISNHRINYEFKYDRRTDKIVIRANTSHIKGTVSTTRVGKLNTQWARTMHGENYLGDVKLAWVSGSDITEDTYQRNPMGELIRGGNGFPTTTNRSRYKFFFAHELEELTGIGEYEGIDSAYFRNENVIPLFVRGEEDQMALVRITQAHRDAALDIDGYWDNEDVPDDMKKEFKETHVANKDDTWLLSANIARHEAMKRILGPDYHTLSSQKMMKRLKAFFTPGISVAGGPDSRIVVFDEKEAIFETELPNGHIITRKGIDSLDGVDQYIGDGMTITSERKFRHTYPKLLGTDPRAKRAKTIIGAQDVDENGVNQGSFIGKHQEMTMYVPIGGKMRVKVGGEVIAEIYSNGETTDIYVNGEYVDHLMTDNEAKIRLGDKYKNNNQLITIPSEATTHVQSVGRPKSYANFPMQLMNYITDPGLLAAVNYMIANEVTSKSTRALIQKAISIGLNGKALDEFLLSLDDKSGDAPRRFVMAAAELGAGRHPSNQGSASVLVNSHLIRKAMSVLQDGSVLDFRPDFSNMVNDDEIILPANVPSIRNKIYQKFADDQGISIEEAQTYNLSYINKWLRENNVRVMAIRYPVPSSLGYGVFRVKSLMGSLSGDSFIVSPKNVKEKFEGDHDHDVGHISFLEDDMLDLLQQNEGSTKGIALHNYLPKGRDTMYKFSNISDMFHLMEELSYGKRSIGEIANVQRVAGIAQNHFESMTLDGRRVVLVPTSSVVLDTNSGIEDTLENILRIYAQAAFDNADFRLLSHWDYSQKNLFKLMFKNADGDELTDSQYNTLSIYLNTLKLNGHVAGGQNVDGRFTLRDMFKVSEQYSLFVEDRERYMAHKMTDYLMSLSSESRANYASIDEVSLKTGSVHPQETLTMMPKKIADENDVDPNTLFNADEDLGKSAIAHALTWKSSVMSDQKRIQMVREVAEDMTEEQIVEEAKKGAVWAQSMINELHKLYKKHRTGSTIAAEVGQTWDHNEEFVYFAQSWYEGRPVGEFSKQLGFNPDVGFKDLSAVAQRAATFDFLGGLRMRDSEGRRINTFNTKMIPPVSREGVTLLDPDVVQNYFTEYNNQLDILDNVDEIANPEKYIAVNKTFTILKKEFGCV